MSAFKLEKNVSFNNNVKSNTVVAIQWPQTYLKLSNW